MYPQWILDNKENYKYLLKEFKNYCDGTSKWEKSCCFADGSTDMGLYNLNQKYHLERLSRNKSDVLQCLTAMEWTFQHLLFKSFSEYSCNLNATNILEFCRKNNKTVNCLCHATVLTEVLLSLGFAARKISCLPIDVVPFDNHVVTTVYVESLNKWIMLDPSLCCYVTNKDGSILSLQEIRYNLVNDIEIEINTFSRFSKLVAPKSEQMEMDSQQYITYLYKNLFRFVSRNIQNSDVTKNNDVFYMLVPNGYLKSNTIQQMIIEDAEVEVRIVDDEKFFWGDGRKV